MADTKKTYADKSKAANVTCSIPDALRRHERIRPHIRVIRDYPRKAQLKADEYQLAIHNSNPLDPEERRRNFELAMDAFRFYDRYVNHHMLPTGGGCEVPGLTTVFLSIVHSSLTMLRHYKYFFLSNEHICGLENRVPMFVKRRDAFLRHMQRHLEQGGESSLNSDLLFSQLINDLERGGIFAASILILIMLCFVFFVLVCCYCC